SGANARDFSQANTCSAALAAGGQCTITVTFHPTANGLRKASIIVTDTAPGSPHVISLSGSTSTVLLSASNLSFGTVTIGATSAAQNVTVTNSVTVPSNIPSIS